LSQNIRLLESLSNAFGPSGCEQEVSEILKSELEDYADEVRVDKLGNVFFYHHGKESCPKIMLSAHMDEIGFLVTFIENEGFLRFEPLGGIPHSLLPGQRLRLRGTKNDLHGIIGTKPPHIMSADEQNKVIPVEDLFIDIGAENSEAARNKGADIGTMGVFDVAFTELGEGYVRGKSLDDRAGCTALATVFKALKNSSFNLVAVGSVQEELGLRGARTAAWQVDPDYGLALEGTFAADVPGTRADRTSAALRKGPVVTIVDKSVVAHPDVLKTLTTVGKEKRIPFQFKRLPLGGTDAGAIHLTKAGVPSGTVAVPCRYIHGPAAVMHLDDLKNTVTLVTEFVKAISIK
jgi:endoglucanase